jgi:hypothetical protein
MKQLTPEELEILNTVRIGDYVADRYASAIHQVVDIIDESNASISHSPFKVRLKKICRANFRAYKNQKINQDKWLPSLFHYRKLTPELLDIFEKVRLEEIDRINELRKLL